VVGLGRTEVRWLESGEIAHEGESAGAYWFRDGKIIRWQPFGTHTEALEAAGCGSRATTSALGEKRKREAGRRKRSPRTRDRSR
jgi:hypothetical protein